MEVCGYRKKSRSVFLLRKVIDVPPASCPWEVKELEAGDIMVRSGADLRVRLTSLGPLEEWASPTLFALLRVLRRSFGMGRKLGHFMLWLGQQRWTRDNRFAAQHSIPG